MEQISTKSFIRKTKSDLSFQGVNRLFVLSFENEEDRKAYTGYYLPKVEIKNYNVMTDEKIFFDYPVKSDTRAYEHTMISKNCNRARR